MLFYLFQYFSIFYLTCHNTVISIIGWMISKEELMLPIDCIYVKNDLTQVVIPFCKDGMLLNALPEEGLENIQECGFYYRYDI